MQLCMSLQRVTPERLEAELGYVLPIADNYSGPSILQRAVSKPLDLYEAAVIMATVPDFALRGDPRLLGEVTHRLQGLHMGLVAIVRAATTNSADLSSDLDTESICRAVDLVRTMPRESRLGPVYTDRPYATLWQGAQIIEGGMEPDCSNSAVVNGHSLGYRFAARVLIQCAQSGQNRAGAPNMSAAAHHTTGQVPV